MRYLLKKCEGGYCPNFIFLNGFSSQIDPAGTIISKPFWEMNLPHLMFGFYVPNKLYKLFIFGFYLSCQRSG